MGTDKTAYGKSGSARQANRDRARAERHQARNNRAAVDVHVLDCELLLTAIEIIAMADGALRVGLSRDKGAFAFGIYGDGEPYTEYVGASEDVNEYLRNLIEYWRTILD